MTTQEFKFSSEGAVIMFLEKYQLLQQTDLKDYAKHQTTFTDRDPCNIYFILKRSRVTISPESFKVNSDHLRLDFEIHKQNEKIILPIKSLKPKTDREISLKANYPYNVFEIYDGNEPILKAKAATFLDNIQRIIPVDIPELDLEVLYVGQSIGDDGKRTAIDRLPQHSKLQNIYAEAISQHPDSEIWLLLTSFQQKNIAAANGQIRTKGNEKEELKRFLNFTNNQYMTFSDEQKINFTEAALIRCFEPLYNEKYKKSFPDPDHISYSECYSLDLNAIVIEVDTSEIKRCLFTEKKPRQLYQHQTFHLPTEKDRWKLFNRD
ncbi:MAG: hypothetical protein IM574_01790 [Cytophagales bacterium]|jgi:hypothetical protein|nr:hypothetical protein [Cytophagales bacterium]MCA6418351.1 hypothetical protein [Cytophagales bacterium]MCA6426706.1 hypothetical protein [Cytophagales bacterium]MCA6431234.1 hypothetical protein [Cytophagales bacterium]MCA6432313.1 hypothetical protein [Cytophagales bacterium]